MIAKIISELDYGPCLPNVYTKPYLWTNLNPGDKLEWVEGKMLRFGTFMNKDGAFANIIRTDAEGMARINVFALNRCA